MQRHTSLQGLRLPLETTLFTGVYKFGMNALSQAKPFAENTR